MWPPAQPSPSKGADEGDFLAAQAIPGGRPKDLPYPNLEDSWETCRAGLAPAAVEVSAPSVGRDDLGAPPAKSPPPVRARPPGRTVPPTGGRPQGSPLQGCKNVCKTWNPRAAQCAAPAEIKKRLRIRRSPEPRPGASLVSFWASREKLAARRR